MIDLQSIIAVYAPKLLLAIAILVLGGLAINLVMRGVRKAMERTNMDANLRPFLLSLLRALLRILLVLAALGTLGMEMTSFVAILGSAGLAIGLALSGTLQNFAGGVLILLFKPYKVGHVIKTDKFVGTVTEIQIFNTLLLTVDNHEVILPNGGLATGSLENFSSQSKRKLIWTFGIAYGDSLQKARQVLQEILLADERILREEPPFIELAELGESSVNLTVRVWVKTEDYWAVHFSVNEKVYEAFSREGLNIPFPQLDVHLHRGQAR